MDIIFEDFKYAFEQGDGYGLSQTLSPIDPPSQLGRLKAFYRSTNAASASKDFKYRVLYDNSTPFKLSQEEGNGWVEVYFAYWKAVGEILKVEDAQRLGTKVSRLLLNSRHLKYAESWVAANATWASPIRFFASRDP